ncbi:type II toxin-antitoxin system VapB family antitoxin [Methylobacterium oxalidis]|uniref:type II toxin-antitoxin system VapB family antitoxin n=1 Tax=Methylobacterium oxalidis TaxID=944322 RepID=UPI003315025D
MTIRIDHEEIEALIADLAARTGRDRDALILDALRRERERLDGAAAEMDPVESARLLRERWKARPLADPRPADEILAYDENGLPV